MQEKGVNLLDQAFEQVTDQQIAAFQVKTNLQRMDSTMVACNIQQVGRLHLLVEVLQRVHRMLSQEDQGRYSEAFAPYLQGHAGQYIYRLKREEFPGRVQQIGELMYRLLGELKEGYSTDPIYQMLERVFREHFRVEEGSAKAKTNHELSATCMQSPDDLEATFRKKGGKGHQGYVANLTETCDPNNKLQLITKVQVAPNHAADSHLLAEALPDLKRRTNLDTIYTDGGHGGQEADAVLQDQHVTHIQTAIRGRSPHPVKLSLADFVIQRDQEGKPVQVTCPQKQQVPLYPGRSNGNLVGYFDPVICHDCQYQIAGQCPTRFRSRLKCRALYFTWSAAHSSQRQRRSRDQQKEEHNLRAAIEATIRSVKLPFPASKLPVRGSFRMSCLLIGSAAMTNVRRLQRYLKSENQPGQQVESFWGIGKTFLMSWISILQPSKLFLGC
jgi:hypothetical protein